MTRSYPAHYVKYHQLLSIWPMGILDAEKWWFLKVFLKVFFLKKSGSWKLSLIFFFWKKVVLKSFPEFFFRTKVDSWKFKKRWFLKVVSGRMGSKLGWRRRRRERNANSGRPRFYLQRFFTFGISISFSSAFCICIVLISEQHVFVSGNKLGWESRITVPEGLWNLYF